MYTLRSVQHQEQAYVGTKLLFHVCCALLAEHIVRITFVPLSLSPGYHKLALDK